MRSLQILRDEGFLSVVQELIDIGAELGKVFAKAILPYSRTVRNRVYREHDNIMEEVKSANAIGN